MAAEQKQSWRDKPKWFDLKPGDVLSTWREHMDMEGDDLELIVSIEKQKHLQFGPCLVISLLSSRKCSIRKLTVRPIDPLLADQVLVLR